MPVPASTMSANVRGTIGENAETTLSDRLSCIAELPDVHGARCQSGLRGRQVPSDFHVTCATVISVLFLALAVQGRAYELVLRTSERAKRYSNTTWRRGSAFNPSAPGKALQGTREMLAEVALGPAAHCALIGWSRRGLGTLRLVPGVRASRCAQVGPRGDAGPGSRCRCWPVVGGWAGAGPASRFLCCCQPLPDCQVLVKVLPLVRLDDVSRTVPELIPVPAALKFVGVPSPFLPATSVIL
jgi:hypothetical protein